MRRLWCFVPIFPFAHGISTERNSFDSDHLLSENSLQNFVDHPLTIRVLQNHHQMNKGETFYLTALVTNSSALEITKTIEINIPKEWSAIPSDKEEITVAPYSSQIQIFAIKTPSDALAGDYFLSLKIEGEQQEYEIKAQIFPQIEFSGHIENPSAQYLLNEFADLKLVFLNKSNTPLQVYAEIEGDPICDLEYDSEPFEILPQQAYEIFLRAQTDLQINSFQQYVFVKLINAKTDEELFRYSFSFKWISPSSYQDDLYKRIPAEFTMMALEDQNHKQVFATELSGAGYIDSERKRFLEFDFIVPIHSQHRCNDWDSSFYIEMSEPKWDITLGDTLYSLSPLTQRLRDARGASVEIYEDNWSTGIHYNENRFWGECNPKETCAFLAFSPTQRLSFSGNYLHKELEKCPSSHTLTFQSDIEYFPNHHLEIECGRSFGKSIEMHKALAYHIEAWGEYNQDTWYNIEKIYAGSNFMGYYRHLNLFSTMVNFPITPRVKGNVSYSQLKQEDHPCCHRKSRLRLHQRQYNSNLSFDLRNGTILALNGFLLRARDASRHCRFDFNQEWIGGIYSGVYQNYSFYTSAQIGHQKSYRTGKTARHLQRYFIFLGQEIISNLYLSAFYETGNINYYDVKPWRKAFGGSLRYRYSQGGSLEVFLQKTKETPHICKSSQIGVNLLHQFKNLWTLNLSGRYCHDKHYRNNHSFFASLTIPFGYPVGRRTDIGSIEGCVYDISKQQPVPQTILNLNNRDIVTGPDGSFHFSNISAGPQCLKIPFLPEDLISPDLQPQIIDIKGGRKSFITIPVVSSCSISGTIMQYNYPPESLIQHDRTYAYIEQGGLPDIRVTIKRDHERYSCLSDQHGCFQFPKLRPGQWLISVESSQLPDLYDLDQNNFILNIQPKENKEVLLQVLPLQRQIFKFEE